MPPKNAKYCAPTSAEPLLAVLGIVSRSANAAFRSAIRHSWARDADESGILPRFVLRGIGLPEAARREALEERDVVLVPAADAADRASGPLLSLMLWYRCALEAWPRAEHIGKADDDVWVHLPGVASHVRSSLRMLGSAAGGGDAPQLFWGQMESYHWDTRVQRPSGFAWKPNPAAGCKSAAQRAASGTGEAGEKSELLGPFPYAKARRLPRQLPCRPAPAEASLLPKHAPNLRVHARRPAKGPIYLLAASLVRAIASSAAVEHDAAATLALVNQSVRTKTGARILPWEDVFTGLALARTGGGGVASVHIGWKHFAERWQFSMARSSLILHLKVKDAKRIGHAHGWARGMGQHCELAPSELHCQPYRSCSGARWRMCESRYPSWPRATNCSDAMVDLKTALGWRGNASARTKKKG